MNVSLRLEELADFCPKCEVIADVGCDHGKLSALLIEKGKVKRVVATDISLPSLKKAELLAKESEYDIVTRLGDGFSPIETGEAECAVVAGMGAMQIVSILSNDIVKTRSFKQFVLSPHNYPEKLREYLNKSGFIIVKEKYIFERDLKRPGENGGRFYPVFMVINGTEDRYTKDEIEFGRFWFDKYDETYLAYLRSRIENCDMIIKASPVEIKNIEEMKKRCILMYERIMKNGEK